MCRQEERGPFRNLGNVARKLSGHRIQNKDIETKVFLETFTFSCIFNEQMNEIFNIKMIGKDNME